MIDYAKLESRLTDCAYGHTVYTYANCGSTQDIAHAIGPTHQSGTLVLAEHQTAGRGRAGRSWTDRRGKSITSSFLLKPPSDIEVSTTVSLLAGMAVLGAIEAQLPRLQENLWLKWPNDVVWRKKDGSLRKLAGILIELHRRGNELSHGVLGIGINVNHSTAELPMVGPEDLEPSSLLQLTGELQDRMELLASLCLQLSTWLHPTRLGFREGRPWEERLVNLGQPAVVQSPSSKTPPLRGIATKTTEDGHIILQDAEGNDHIVTDDRLRHLPEM